VSVEEEAEGCTLACRVGPTPTGPVSLSVVGKMVKSVSKGFQSQVAPPATTK
jgi:hypothetical protein